MVTVAIIGAGYWGPNLIRNIHRQKHATIGAICDLDQSRLDHIHGLYPSIPITTNLDNVLKDKTISAVIIATPVHTHYSLAKLVLTNDKHVLIEKPITTNSKDAEDLIKIAAKNKKILMVDHTFVYAPAVQKMKEIIDKKELGDLFYFDSVRVNLGLFQQNTNVLWDLATHDLSIMDSLLGTDPIDISAIGSSHIKKGIENIVYVTIRFPNNLIGHIHVNWLAPVKLRLTLLSGTKKMIVYNDMEPIEKIKIYDKGITFKENTKNINLEKFQYRIGDMYSPRLDDVEALYNATKHFIECIMENKTPITDGIKGLRIVRMLEAAEMSLKHNGKFIKITL